MSRIQRIALTGSECTGKTTLAARLAEHYRTVWVPESARSVAEARGEPLGVEDVERIAAAQIAAEDGALARASRLLVLDADLLSTAIYSRHYYGTCPDWIERAARERLADLYLLHHPDVPWLPDPVRDRGERRAEMHGLFRAALESHGARIADVLGDWAERERRAVLATEEVLRSGRRPLATAPRQASSGLGRRPRRR